MYKPLQGKLIQEMVHHLCIDEIKQEYCSVASEAKRIAVGNGVRKMGGSLGRWLRLQEMVGITCSIRSFTDNVF